jgi:hypothetical protein
LKRILGRETHEHVLWENLNERSHLKDIGVDESRILHWILKKSVAIDWTRLISFRMRPSGGRAVAQKFMNFWVTRNGGKLLTS